jgi:hypothetical protein
MLEMKIKTIYYKRSKKMAQINQILDAWNEKKTIYYKRSTKMAWSNLEWCFALWHNSC